MSAVNETMRKFGYPRTTLIETPHWVVLVRPQQPTLGALVLACREPVKRLSDVSAEAFLEMKTLVGRIEDGLKVQFAYDKINYLCLMMVDPDVHFHVIPRYATPRDFEGVAFADAGWPAVPSLGQFPALDDAVFDRLIARLRQALA
jgi:diadenosine tetraphosphate (Ap4A) HIT family hydrolase